MPNLFSHAHEPDYVSPTEHAEFDGSVILTVPVDQAFDGFTDGMHLWWPVSEQSMFGAESHVALLRDHVVEESDEGQEVVWADITEWQLGEFIRLHWVLGQEQYGSVDVDIHFEALHDGQTRVRVITEQNTQRQDQEEDVFICDWPLILSRYARFMGGVLKLD
ncbi:hypothetical protein ACFUCV_14940 [Specibacter sp. NPDC057265]|uniref:hypothetical protein n=1 Tax=Specibacter sp. NPDC057265 TaxID=3346075 RepID=UPI00363C5C23